MRHRILQPALVAGVALSLAVAGGVFADTVHTGTDQVSYGVLGAHDLGEVAPGGVRDVTVAFRLDCAGTQHVDAGQQVIVTTDGGSVPTGGSVAMDPVALGPVPLGWAADGAWCGSEVPIVAVGTIRVTAPAVAGPHTYSILFNRLLDPAGSDDEAAFGVSLTALDVALTVVETTNTPPVLALPADMTVAADHADGWTADYAVTATDAEDEPDPTPICTPAPGTVVPLGTTVVACSVTDAGGLTAEGSFSITVTPKPDVVAPPAAPAAVVAAFDPPVKAGALNGQAGRTIPLKVRLAAGGEPVGEGSLVVAVTPCAGGDAVAEVAMDWRAASGRWFGLLRTKGLEAGCHAVRALHDGVDVGGFELTLVDRRAEVAKEKAAAAKDKTATGKEKAAAKGAPKAKPADGKPAGGQGTGRRTGG